MCLAMLRRPARYAETFEAVTQALAVGRRRHTGTPLRDDDGGFLPAARAYREARQPAPRIGTAS
jgi:hypothetical protein